MAYQDTSSHDTSSSSELHTLLNMEVSKALRGTIRATGNLDAYISNLRWRLILKAVSLLGWPVRTYLPSSWIGALLHELSHFGIDEIAVVLILLRSRSMGNAQHLDTQLRQLLPILFQLPKNSPRRHYIHHAIVQTLRTALHHPSFKNDSCESEQSLSGSILSMAQKIKALTSRYSRTKGANLQPAMLPDPGLVFDMLMERDARRQSHHSQLSSIFFYLTSIIHMDVFAASHNVTTRRTLDLSPLYGSSQIDQSGMRQFQDGLLKADCFASRKALLLPPGVGAFLIMLNRFHNHVATRLALINDSAGSTLSPELSTAAAQSKRDDDLFHTARLATCGLYLNIIKNDYLRTLMNLNRTASTWTPEIQPYDYPSNSTTTSDNIHKKLDLVYSLHSTLSERDAAWTEETLRQLLGGHDPRGANITCKDMEQATQRFEDSLPEDVEKRNFAGLFQRQAVADTSLSLSDDALVQELRASIQDVAGAVGARRTPSVLKPLEVGQIQRARDRHTGTLNDFRQSLGLKPYGSVEDINPDPRVVDALGSLYGHPDDVELYPGLVIEATKQPSEVPGLSDLCAGPTASYAMLCDLASLVAEAVTAVAGQASLSERSSSSDVSSVRLTDWARDQFQSDADMDHGCVLHKLILTAFPRHFAPDSAYAHYPLVTPEGNRCILSKLKLDHQYSFQAPSMKPDAVVVSSIEAQQRVSVHQTVAGLPRITTIRHSSDDHVYRDTVQHTSQLLLLQKRKNSSSPCSSAVTPTSQSVGSDLVSSIAGPIFAKVYSTLLPLPLSEKAGDGLLTMLQLEEALGCIYVAEANLDVTKDARLQTRASDAVEMLRSRIIMAAAAAARPTPSSSPAVDGSGSGFYAYYYWLAAGKLFDNMRRSVDVDHSMCPRIRALACVLISLQHMIVECVDWYLAEEEAEEEQEEGSSAHLPTLRRLASELLEIGGWGGGHTHREVHTQNGLPPVADHMLRHMLEGTRLALGRRDAAFKRVASREPFVVFDMTAMSRDPLAFPDPDCVRLDRPLALYRYLGFGEPSLRSPLIQAALAVFVSLVSLEGLRRSPGECGRLRRVAVPTPMGLWRVKDEDPGRRDSGICLEADRGSLAAMLDDDWVHVEYGEGSSEKNCELDVDQGGVGSDTVTLYLIKDGRDLSPLPDSLRVTWKTT